ncbi:MAG: D-glycero-beta-D-manno-heptose-7-phosphate kinase [Bacteroidetes bacterium HGW-Bacteroidetes-6]|jgi:rfaE bifunctional protein kinase chain/domain|nr:MAG: D-glycero-beta-D-manno-heptose-7-phosphate kinase [Bacteroidetes bacterium HGW-Bacteroidetes-6]
MKTSSNPFSGKKILIIGDVMLDSYIWGNVDRISPEAPVPIVAVEKRENRLGGAANVALNINALESIAVLAAVIGADDKAEIFANLLQEQNIPVNGLLNSAERKTTTKFRIIGNNVQMLRVDEETDTPLPDRLQHDFGDHVEKLLTREHFDAIVFEDYDKGVIDSTIIENVIAIANKRKVPVLVDPKKRNFMAYKSVTVFKPNLKELREALNADLPEDIGLLAAKCEEFRRMQDIRYLLLTLGERGMLLCHAENNQPGYFHIPSRVRNVADVSGAGDTVIAVAALALTLGATPSEMAVWSNMAAGIVCEYVGVVPVNKDRFLSLLNETSK